MTAVFHKFSDLPAELRDIIWEFAIRPDAPGVHFFTLDDGPLGKYAPTTSCPCRPSTCGSCNCNGVKGLRGFCVGKPVLVGAPVMAPDSQRSQIVNDPSTCLVDAGLWMACKASRAVISHKLGMPSWKGMRDEFWQKWTVGSCNGPWASPVCDSDDAPRFGRFWHGDDNDRTPFVFPRNDLFCLRRTRGTRGPSRSEFPRRLSRLLSSHAPCETVHHWAFEFDATWDFNPHTFSPWWTSRGTEDMETGDFYCWMKKIFSDGRGPCNVYLIDYVVRLKPGAKRKTTFHGNGCKFVDSDDVDADSVRVGIKKVMQQLNSWSSTRFSGSSIQVRLLACVKD